MSRTWTWIHREWSSWTPQSSQTSWAWGPFTRTPNWPRCCPVGPRTVSECSYAPGVPWRDACRSDQCVRFGGLDGRHESPAATLAPICVARDDTTADRPGVEAAGLRAPVLECAIRPVRGYHTVALGCDPVVPVVTGIPASSAPCYDLALNPRVSPVSTDGVD